MRQRGNPFVTSERKARRGLIPWRAFCAGVKVAGGRPLLAFGHKFGDEGLKLGHLSLEFLDAACILGDAMAVER